MSGLESYLIGLAGNLTTDAVERLRGKPFQKTLASMVVDASDLPVSKRKLERFLASDHGWKLLVTGDASNRSAIEAELRALVNPTGRKATRWSTERLDAAVGEGARVLLTYFLASLSGEEGREVADYRNDRRTHLVRADIQALGSKQFETTLAALPSACRHWLQDYHDIDSVAAGRLARVLEDWTSLSHTVADEVATDPLPEWLSDIEMWQGWEAVGQFLLAYGLSSSTAESHAVEKGSPHRALYLCRQAINASNNDAVDEANRLLAEAPDDQDLIVRTTAAYVAREAAAVTALTEDAPTGHLIEDAQVLVTRLRIWALANDDRVDAAIDAAERLTARFPERAGAWTTLAELAFAESQKELTGSDRQSKLYENAAFAAGKARELVHSWNGDAVEMSRLLIRMLTMLDRIDEAIRIGTPPPQGDATPTELADPEIRGITEITRAIFQRTADAGTDIGDYYRHFCNAVLAVEEDEQVNELKASLAAATEDDQRITTQLFLARRKHIDPDRVEQARAVSGEAADLIEATYATAVGDYATAEARLRPHTVSEPHVTLLADVLCAQGTTDEAVSLLETAAGDLGNDTLAAIAVSKLVGVGRSDDAELIALRLLALSLPKGDGSHHIRRFLIEQAQSRNDLNEMVRCAKALLRDFEDVEAAWVIVYANYVAGRFRVAWDELQNLRLDPYDERTAIIAVELTGRYRSDDPYAANAILAISREFPDNEMVHACAIGTVMTRFGQTPLPEDTLQRFRNLTDEFLHRYPESSAFTSIDTSDIETLVERLKEMLAPAARARAEVAAGVRASVYPFGALASMLDRVHTVLAYASAYPVLLPVVAEHEISREADRVGAEQALGQPVAVDQTVALIDGLFAEQNLWGLAQQHLAEMRTTSELVADAERSLDKASDQRDGFINFDPFDDRFIVTDDTSEQDARLHELVSHIRDRIASCGNSPAPDLPPRIRQPDDEHRLVWLGPLALAVDQGIALYTEDAHLRRIAREFSIPAFGTDALLDVLVKRGVEPVVKRFEFEKACVEHNLGDIPAALGFLNIILIEHDFRDTTRYASNLARPAVWRRHHDLLSGFNDLIRHVVDTDPDSIPAWVFAATTGLGLALIPEARESVLGMLILGAIVASHCDPYRTASILAAGRSAAARLDPHQDLDPAPAVVRRLWELLADLDIDFDERRQYITTLFGQCGDDVARDLTRAILGLDPAHASHDAGASDRRQ